MNWSADRRQPKDCGCALTADWWDENASGGLGKHPMNSSRIVAYGDRRWASQSRPPGVNGTLRWNIEITGSRHHSEVGHVRASSGRQSAGR